MSLRASAFCWRVVRTERVRGGMSSREMSAPSLPLTVAGGVGVMVVDLNFDREDLVVEDEDADDGERERGGSGGSGGRALL